MAKTAWDILKKQIQSGTYNDYEREQARSLSVVDKDEETKRRYREYVAQVMESEKQAEIAQRQMQAAEQANRPNAPVQITAGAANLAASPQVQARQIRNDYDNWENAMEKAEFIARNNPQVADSIKQKTQGMPTFSEMPAEDKYKLYVENVKNEIRDAGKSQEYKNWRAKQDKDPEFRRKSEEEKHRQYMLNLENTAKQEGTLPESQRYELTEYKYGNLNDKERAAINTIMQVEAEDFEEYEKYGRYGGVNAENGGVYAAGDRNKRKLEAINSLKSLGWNDQKIESEVARYQELADFRKTQELNKEVAIDPNAPMFEQKMQATKNLLGSVARNAFAPIESLGAENGAYGRNTSSKYLYSTNRSNEERNQILGFIGDDNPVGQMIASGAMSSADSLVQMLMAQGVTDTFGVLGAGNALKEAKAAGNVVKGMKAAAATEKALEVASLVPFSIGAYNSGYKEGINRGFSEKQAQWYGAAVGGIEAATEIASLDKLWDMASATKVGRNLFMSYAVQAGIEGSEEVASNIGDRFADWLAVKVGKTGKTQKDLDIETYIAEHPGASREEAAAAATQKFIEETIEAGVTGTISALPNTLGSSMAGFMRSRSGGDINQAISDRYQSLEVTGDTDYEQMLKADKEKYQNNPTQFIVDNYKAADKEGERIKAGLQEIADKEREGKKLSASDKAFIAENAQIDQAFVDKLYDTGEDSVVPYEFRDVRTDIPEDDARRMLAEAAASGDSNKFADVAQAVMNSSDENVSKNADEIISEYAGMAQSHGITQESIGQAVLSQKKAYLAGLKGENIENLSDKNKIAYNEGKKAAIEERARTTIENDAIKNTEVATKNGTTVKLMGAFTDEGIQTSNGNMKVEDLELTGDSAAIKAYQYADRYDNVNVKNAFISNIQDGVNIEQYRAAFDKMYDSAMAGVSFENAKKSVVSKFADEGILEAAYKTGETERSERSYKSLAQALGEAKSGTGEVVNESSSSDADMVDFFSKLARATGLTFKIVDELEQKNARGSFKVNESTITVRADRMDAVYHELGEFTETYNKAEYDDLRHAIADFSSYKLGHDKYMRFLKDYQRAYERAGQDSSADEMSGEMFNDTISIMMRSDKGRQALADFLAKNYGAEEAKSIGQKAADLMRKLGDAVKKAFKGEKNGYEGEMEKYADQLGAYAGMFVKALDKAVQNYQKSQGSAVQGEEKFSLTVDDSFYSDSEGNEITGKKLLGTILLGRLEDGYKEYVNGSKNYEKTKDGNVIIPIEGIGGGTDKIVIIDSSKYQLIAKKIYSLNDNINNRDKAAALIEKGERDGRYTEYREGMRFVFGEQGVTEYLLRNHKTNEGSSFDTEGMDSFKNNGFGRNSLNREGLNSQSTGSKSDVAKGSKYSLTVDSQGNKLSEDQIEYFNDSKVRDDNGSLKVMYHGTYNKFTVFDPKKLGGKNGTAEGYGIYFADTQDVTNAYGNEQMKGYLNVTHPATSYQKTITNKDLAKLIKATAENEAAQMVADGEYDSIGDALKDSWVSNYVYTNDKSMDAVYKQVADEILKLNGHDMDIIQEVMGGIGIRNYEEAYDFYGTLGDTLGIDGFVTEWESSDGKSMSEIVVAFNSNQFKNIDNKKPTEDPDIRYSLDLDDDRVYYVRGTEVVKNPSDSEYRQMRENILKERPWMRDMPGEPLLRHTYDEEGNTYYWDAAKGIHAFMEPEINKHWNTRTSQHWEWWTKEDKDDYPIDYSTRYSLGGIGAFMADTESLDEARQMEKDGKSADAIWKETGWYKGADGKWRFEIDDSDAEVTNLDRLEKNKPYRLPSILKYDELYKAYPQLNNIEVVIKDLPGNTYGNYDVHNKVIQLDELNAIKGFMNSRDPKDIVKATLLHEIQHAIQGYEHFARGASPSEWNRRMTYKNEVVSQHSRLAREYRNKLNNYLQLRDSLPKDLTINYARAMEMVKDDSTLQKGLNLFDELEEKYGELYSTYDDALFEKELADEAFRNSDPNEYLKPYEAYEMTAGEIEARQAEERMNWDKEKRKKNMPKTEMDRGVLFAENEENPWEVPEKFSMAIDNLMDTEIEELDDFEDEIDNAVAQAFEEEFRTMAAEKNPKVKKERAKHLLRSMLGKEFDVVDGKRIAFTDDRIEKLLKMYAASNQDYGQAYLTYMSPADYLLLTTNGNDGTRSLDRIKNEAGKLDVDELKNVYDTQPIFLDLAEKGVGRATKNEITGHEGRHRMYALQMAGFNQIPVLVFNYDNKYNKKAIDSIDVYPQSFNEDVKYNKSNLITLNNLQPLSRGNEDNIRQMFGEGQQADLRFSLDVDSEGRTLTEGQQRYFNNSKVVDDNGALKVMYHGARGAGFTVFNADYSDDGRSIFFTDDARVAKSYIGTFEKFKPLKPMTFDDLASAMEGYTGGDLYLEEDGDDVVVMEFGTIQDGDKEVYRGNLKGAQEYFIDSIKDQFHNTDANYEVYLNLQNPYILDAKGANWDELNQDAAWSEHFGDVQINKLYDRQYNDAGYEAEWMGQDFTWHHETFESKEDLEKQFGKISELFEGDELFINDIYLDKDGNRIPTNTRMLSQMAQEMGHDGVIIKNVYDIGMYADIEENVSSTIAIAFNPEQIKDVDNLNPTSSEDIRYALDLEDEGGWIDFGAPGATQTTEEDAINVLEKGMEALKNKEVDVPKLRTLALKLRHEYGSAYNTNTLTDNLRKAFAYMQTEDHVDYKTMMGILKDIARPVIEQSGEKIGEQEYKDFLSYFKGKKIKLTSKQKEEVRYAFGSYKNFRNAVMPITFSDNADTTLDQLWDEMVEQSGYMLDRDASEGDMPANLLDVLQAMRPTMRNDFGGDIDDVSKDLAMRIVEEYIEGEAAKEMHKDVQEYRARLKKDYQERRKELTGQINAELRARNKRQAEQAKEREQVRILKGNIRVNANKLMTWVEKPTEGKSVPHNMMVPVVQFLQAIDFVDPVIMQGDDGKWHTRVLDHYDIEDGHAKNFTYKDIEGDTYEEVLQKFNDEIGRGKGTKDQRAWTEKMQGIREIYDKVLKDSDFEDTSMDFLMQTLDAQGLAEDFDDLLAKHKGELNMNHLDSKDLGLIDNIIKNIFHALNKGNKAFSKPSVDIANLAQSTIADAEGKEVKSRGKIRESLYKMLRLDNVTPRTFFKLMGNRGIEVYKFLRSGLNQEILDLKKASEFMEDAMKGIDASKWTGNSATIHEFPLSSGTVRMTDAQIMGLYMTIRRKGGMDRIKGGIKVDEIKTKGLPIKQKVVHLTDSDIQKIESVLTPEQIDLAKKMQQYMANDCSAMGNDTSMKLYGYKKFTDDTYYPWSVDRETIATTNSSENIPMFTGIERSGFTKQLKEGATNPLVIKDIFDVFTDHISQMAAYHGYAASVKDTLRWMNYREQKKKDGFIEWITNKNAINALTGSNQGVGYINKLLLDINKANESQYIGNMTDILMGNYKAAAVGANLRVVAQQPTAYFRALNQIDPKYLFSVNPSTAVKNIKKSQEESPISWWKSKGYYETNLGQPIKEIVTGIASPMEKAKDILMSPAGWADDVTWGFLYTAVEKEQRDLHRGEKITPDEFRKMVNDRFDEVVDNTQVVDSTLHRSQYMRSADRLNKIQTAFMAEPTKSYNMLLEAAIEDLNDGTKNRTARAITAFLLAALATSAAAAVVDTMRKAKDDDKWWEVWLNNLKENMADNMNPFNLLPVVKDVSAAIYNQITGASTYGQSGNRFDIEAITSVMNAVNAWKKLIDGENNKTGYGFVMANLKPISQITGVPLYGLTRDIVALYNTFFDNIETTVNSQSAGRNEIKKDFVKDVNRERSDETLEESITDALNHGVSIYDLKGAIQSEYKNKYFDLYSEGKEEDAWELADKAARAYARMGLTDEEIDEIINGWQEEAITYTALDKAIASGEGIEDEVKHVQEGKDDDKIIKHIMDRYTQTVAYEDTHDTESAWRSNVETALQTVDPTLTFDSAHEEAIEKKKAADEKAATTAKNTAMKQDFYDAVEKMDGSAGRKALETMKNEGIEAKTVKSAVSTRYHEAWKEAKKQGDTAAMKKAESDWKSAYKLVNNVYNSKSDNLDQTWKKWEKEQE